MDSKLREEIYRLHAHVCGGLADANRLLILYTLSQCVCNVSELAETIELSQPTVSRHLKILRERGLVAAERKGQSVYYSLMDPRIIEALDLLRAFVNDLIEKQTTLLHISGTD